MVYVPLLSICIRMHVYLHILFRTRLNIVYPTFLIELTYTAGLCKLQALFIYMPLL